MQLNFYPLPVVNILSKKLPAVFDFWFRGENRSRSPLPASPGLLCSDLGNITNMTSHRKYLRPPSSLSSVFSSWCRIHNCLWRSIRGRAACEVAAPGAPSRNTWPAPRDSNCATTTGALASFVLWFKVIFKKNSSRKLSRQFLP